MRKQAMPVPPAYAVRPKIRGKIQDNSSLVSAEFSVGDIPRAFTQDLGRFPQFRPLRSTSQYREWQ